MINRNSFVPSTKNVNLTMLELPNCVSLSEYGRCGRLNILKCLGRNCPFKRNSQEEKDSQERWHQQLLSLSKSTQLETAKKYYGGSMPWKDQH